jgi:Ca2+-binding EF-hand superfamily protein
VLPNSQALKHGVQKGWQIYAIDQTPFSMQLVKEKAQGGAARPYRVTFLKVPFSEHGFRLGQAVEFRTEAGEWEAGMVTGVIPLKVKKEGQAHKEANWQEVRPKANQDCVSGTPGWDWRFHQDWTKQAFALLDKDGSGQLDTRELHGPIFNQMVRELLTDLGELPPSLDLTYLVQFLVRQGDQNGDGRLSLGEFQNLTWRVKNVSEDVQLEVDFVFSIFDTDGNGHLSRDEFKQLVSFVTKDHVFSEKDIDTLLNAVDGNNDGAITKTEYRRWLNNRLKAESDKQNAQAGAAEPTHRKSSKEPMLQEKFWESSDKFVTLELFGKLGVEFMYNTGEVMGILPNSQAQRLGVQKGWQIYRMDDLPYSKDLLRIKCSQKAPFRIAFLKVPFSEQGFRLGQAVQFRTGQQRSGEWLEGIVKSVLPLAIERDGVDQPWQEVRSKANQECKSGTPGWDWHFHKSWAKRVFSTLDRDGSGELDLRELGGSVFEQSMRVLLSDGEELSPSIDTSLFVKFLMREGDADGSGTLSLGEFLNITWRLKNLGNDLSLETDFVFSIFDSNQDGKLTTNEFKELITFACSSPIPILVRKEDITDANVRAWMSTVDDNNDGYITRTEFRDWATKFLKP